MATVVVIGAAGFVGMELVNLLEERGHHVIAIARNNGKFLLQKNRCVVLHPSEVTERNDVNVVINLAYPNSGSVHHYSKRNREILRMIKQLAGNSARVIHTSTLAVFGFQLEYPIAPVPVANRRDYLYVESKIELENLLQKSFSKERLAIVRLGNVWGKKSAAWTAPLIDRLLFGMPVGVVGQDGYSNITDVANVVSYLTFLAEQKQSPSMLFHHLAEFGETRWSYWIQKICSVIASQSVYIPSAPHYPQSMGEEITAIFSPVKPRAVYKKLVFGRFTGSLVHSIIGRLPEEYFAQKKQKSIQPLQVRQRYTSADEVFFWVMSCSKNFASITDPEWKPVLAQEQSWERVSAWMEEIGYLKGLSAV